MDQEPWPSCSSSHSAANACWPATYSSRKYDRFVSYNMAVSTRSSKAPIWRQLWRKLKKEKKRMFRRQCCVSNSMRFTYDSTYSLILTDPRLSRSFSARFAVPSTIFDKNRLMV
ncbi:UNVERIFIED_CONTAM: hypothetical protein Sangu_2079100 [Sesamum angustifolium]|uniref:Uncharacterized protein n=1 Tax=Sesamum angustifolium TaxID=2727405 RepID=A0AAW2LJE2_9LAMI